MLALTEITARLTAQVGALTTVTLLENVSDSEAVSTAALLAPAGMPAAYVYSLGDEWEPDGSINCIGGQWTSRFAVLLMVVLPGAGVSTMSTSLRDAMLTALVGFGPTSDGWGQVEPVSGSPIRVEDNRVLWRDEFFSVKTKSYS